MSHNDLGGESGLALICVGQIGKLYVRKAQEAIRNPQGGLVHEGQRRLEVKFVRAGRLPEHARAKAMEKLSFTGLPENADPLSSLTWLDTAVAADENGWTEEEQQYVEDFLRSHDGNGFIIVDMPKVGPPVPNWVKLTTTQGQRKIEHVVQAALDLVNTAGLDVGAVIAFEQQEQRKESQAIIEALSPVTEEEPEPLMAV